MRSNSGDSDVSVVEVTMKYQSGKLSPPVDSTLMYKRAAKVS